MSPPEVAEGKQHSRDVDLPSAALLDRLAISESGFVFDPVTGNSYTLNLSGLTLLRRFQRTADLEELVALIVAEFDVPPRDAERDIIEFAATLRQHLKP